MTSKKNPDQDLDQELGRLLDRAREEYFASGGKPLSRDEVNAYVAELRSGARLPRGKKTPRRGG